MINKNQLIEYINQKYENNKHITEIFSYKIENRKFHKSQISEYSRYYERYCEKADKDGFVFVLMINISCRGWYMKTKENTAFKELIGTYQLRNSYQIINLDSYNEWLADHRNNKIDNILIEEMV